jgi:predicted transcriptional regulator of viral defense system
LIVGLIRKNRGTISTAEAKRAGVSRTTLAKLAAQGIIERVARGQYTLPGLLPDELYLWQLRMESLIYSHETALFLLDMAERTPAVHSITIPSTAKLSATFPVKLKVYYVKPELHNLGIIELPSKQGHKVRTYGAERTVCDVIRSRNRMDDQTVVSAVKNYVNRSDKDLGKLAQYAAAFHITKILRGYLEVLL